MESENNNDVQEYENVFQQYLEICKQAITRNKKSFPYTEIWNSRFIGLGSEAKLEAIIFDDRPKLAYVLRLTKDMEIEIIEKKTSVSEDGWPFTYQYLKRVIENPKHYIENPAKLEWGWLKTVFGPV